MRGWMAVILLGLFAFSSFFGVSGAAAGKDATFWGEWKRIDGKWCRRVIGPGAIPKGISFWVDASGAWYSRVVLPDAHLAPLDPPDWFSGAGKDEGMPGELRRSLEWGEWERIDGVWYRLLLPPGRTLLGSSLYADEAGRLYRRVVYPNAPMTPEDAIPSWYPGVPPGGMHPCLSTPDPSSGKIWTIDAAVVSKGRTLRRVVAPCSEDDLLFVDEKGGWYRRIGGEGDLVSTDVPAWFDGKP